MLTAKTLKALGESGLWPGPQEEEKSFLERVSCMQKPWPKEVDGKGLASWTPPVDPRFGATPRWIPLTYCNRGLLPWQGAALWVFSHQEPPLIQLRRGFRKGRFCWYSKEEVLKHEMVHALRIAFEEPRFEELLAYAFSTSKWRQVVGPLFRQEKELSSFLWVLGLSLAIQIVWLMTATLIPPLSILWIASSLPLGVLGYRSFALFRDRRILRRALHNLSQAFAKTVPPLAIALRLSDVEIQEVATLSTHELLDYFLQKAPHSLHIRQILAQLQEM